MAGPRAHQMSLNADSSNKRVSALSGGSLGGTRVQWHWCGVRAIKEDEYLWRQRHQLPVLPSNSRATKDPSGRKASQHQDDGREDCFRYTSGGRHLRPVPSLLLLVQHLWPGSFASLPSLHAHAGQQGEPCSKSHSFSLFELFSPDVPY